MAHLQRSTYYYHRKRRDGDRYGAVRREIQRIFAGNMGRYGYRRVTLALRQEGTVVNHKTVLRLMREMGLQGKARRRRYRPYRGEAGKAAPNLLRRDFRAAGPVLHSDQGWQYRMKEYRQLLREHGIAQNMSRKGNCLDNAAMECFFGRLKAEMFHGERFSSADELVGCLEAYIRYWNDDRLSLALDGMTPVRYRDRPPAV